MSKTTRLDFVYKYKIFYSPYIVTLFYCYVVFVSVYFST